MKETEVAKLSMPYFKDLGWEIYQEVQLQHGGIIFDFVFKRGKIIGIGEVKNNFSWKLLDQCVERKFYANFVWAITPNVKHGSIIEQTCHAFGIGWITTPCLQQRVCPILNRKALTHYFDGVLHEQHKTYAEAGNAKSERWSPFKQTCENVVEIVNNKPGIKMKDLMKKLDHHYANDATAKSALATWGWKGMIRGVKLKNENNRLKWYPDKPSPPLFERM